MRLDFGGRIAAVTAVAVLVFGPIAAAAADTPEALMRKIMASYREDAKEPNAAIGQNYFDPAFTKLDRDNSRLMDGVDVLDADPICECQDVGGTYKWTGRSEGADRWVATVGRDDMKETWQVVWKRIGGRWRIYDVVESDRGSIRALLERHNNCARQKIAHHQSVEPCADLK